MTKKTIGPKQFEMPKNENELIERLKWFKQNEDNTTVRTYYALGRMIVAVYKKEYGKDKQQKLVDETGFSKSTLYKCRQFALNYTSKQVDNLFQGKFTLPWRVVASNLSIEADNFIKHYHSAETPDEMWNALHNQKKAEGAEQANKSGKEKKIPRNQLEAKLREYEKTIILKDEEIDDLKSQKADLAKMIDNVNAKNAYLSKKIDELMAKNAEDETYEMAESA